jgi:hypothetical protein
LYRYTPGPGGMLLSLASSVMFMRGYPNYNNRC